MKNIVFMGTPEFAIPCLEALIEKYNVVLVVSQPDRPSGRGRKVKPTPIKKVAIANNIEVYQPENINSEDSLNKLKTFNADFYVVVAYGQIIKQKILDLPEKATVNVHASLLPEYRGGAPIHRAILDGKEETGVTTMIVEKGLDKGPILLQKSIKISNEYTTGYLHDILAKEGANLLIETIDDFCNITPRKQCNDQSTYAKLLEGEDRVIDWSKDGKVLYNQIRGLYPWPLAYTCFEGKRLIITKAKLVEACDGDFGEVIKINEKGPVIKAGKDTALILLEVKPQGRSAISGDDFLRGYQLNIGDKLK
jgi:methionyl-tRNA formyltransferase